MKNICIFGDSLAKGVIMNEEKEKYLISDSGFASLMEKKCGFSVRNYAKFGCTIEKGAGIIEKHIADIESSDTIMLEFGGNDSDHIWSEVSENPDRSHFANTEITTFTDIYENIVKRLINMGKEIIILNLPPIDANKYFSWISRGKNSENIKKWLGSIEYIYRWHEMYNAAVCRVARKMKVKLIDMRSCFLEKRNFSDYICLDGIHPNEKGQRLMLDAISFSLCCHS